ncbi:MAG: hypothetical protein ACK504_08915, partial [Bacteroidota bacterium]
MTRKRFTKILSTLRFKIDIKVFNAFVILFFGLHFELASQNTLDIVGLPSSTPSNCSYSLRKLSTSYLGNAILVRRSSDNATQNIGYLASGHLDTTSLKSFVGAGNGFINTWYDQSGNNRNAIQLTLANQPRIVNGGIIERQNGVPTIYFTGNSFLSHNSFPTTGFSGFSANIVAKWTTVGNAIANIQTLLDNNHTGTQGFNIQDRPDLLARPITFGITATPSGAGVQDNSYTGNGNTRILTFIANNTTVSGFRDGNALTTSAISSTTYVLQTRFVIGAWYNSGSISRYTLGYIPEVILFSSALSTTERITLECNQSNYYNVSFASASNLEFYIQGSIASSACNTADEEVVWKNSDFVNTQSNGNSLIKTQSNGNWDGGAASWNTVSNNGCLKFTAIETNTNRMAGLSTSNVNSSFTSIQYASFLRADGLWEVYESGVSRGVIGAYATNDVFKISVESNIVKYYQNNVLKYISGVNPTLPLLVDVSIFSQNGTVSNAIVSNYNTGNFTANAINAGVTPSYQWKLNGANVGTNSPSYSNTSLNNNDVVTCILTYSGVCGSNLATSNAITNKFLSVPTSIDLYIQGTPAPSACKEAISDVVWNVAASSLRNNITGNSLNKLTSDGNWDGNGFSLQSVNNNGYMQTKVIETNKNRMIGLSSIDLNSSFTSIQFALFLRGDGILEIYESGTSRGTFGTYATNDILKIAVESNIVKYYDNGVPIYISTIAPTLPLFVDVSTFNSGATVSAVKVSNGNIGIFTSSVTGAGPSPTYQWKLNGVNVGTNSTTYSNTTLSNNDVITCVVTPDLGGCSASTYTSNNILISDINQTTQNELYITGAPAPSACKEAISDVVWKIAASSLRNTITGNSLSKLTSDGNWDGNGFSLQSIGNNGYMQTTITETNRERMIGLSATDANSSFASIQFAFYLRNNGTFNIFESGADRGGFGAYAVNDIFKIAVENNIVKYYKNGAPVYISTIAPTLPLFVDVSINQTGGKASNVKISNGNISTFTVVGTNLGPAPTYQWKLNGVNVGTNSTTYSNTTLSNNDVITCVVTPDLGGCSA